MVQCQSCGARYDPIQADGMQYFHRCPPLSRAELQAAVDDGRVQLPKGETVDDAVQRRTYERANLRDENRVTTRGAAPDAIVAAGAGVLEVTPDPMTAPVITVDAAPLSPTP